jgi:putative endonuclease
MHHRALLGRAGEDLVARWYQNLGYEVVARNWRNRTGEIDLVVQAGSVLIIVEVKTRTSDRFGSGADAVNATKQKRLRRLAYEFAAEMRATQSRVRPSSIRIDVAVVSNGQVRVIPNAC